jgi:transposase
VIVRPQKISSGDLEEWVPKHITKNDEVVIEAMSCSWVMVDLLRQYAARVVVAHPNHVKLIAASFVKTDKRDAIALARLLAANIIPEVWIPPKPVRELRSLIYQRTSLIHLRASAKCRLRSIYMQYRIIEPEGREAFSPDYWNKLELPPVEKLRVRLASDDIQTINQQLQETETMISQLSIQEPWAKDMPYLVQLPGIGFLTAMTILAAIGDISRFPSSQKLVGYAGLGVRIHSSGLTTKSGGITKQGRNELRYAMVEAAWNAIGNSPFWKQKYERLVRRMEKQKAATAIARKLLVVVWNVLSHREVDRAANLEIVGRSLWIWGSKNRLASSQGLKRIEFAGEQLHEMGIKLDKITYCSTVYKVPVDPAENPVEKEKQPMIEKEQASSAQR